ncbi:MAG TPA: hypothetical protein VK158_01715 [Acidobacteriota bacterium]|nr:hypothetical protein [Acidobacteriota bacterium]
MKRNIKFYRTTTLVALVVSLVIVVLLVLAAYAYPQLADSVPFFSYAVHFHFALMVIAILLSIIFGFVWARILTNELEVQTAQTQTLGDVVLQFLSVEERAILQHLTKKGGSCLQQEFAYLNNMGRVKAMRTVQKLAQRGIISVHPHGKQRQIKLLFEIASHSSEQHNK